MQVMRWLQLRGAAIRHFHVWTPDCSRTSLNNNHRHLQGASMLLLAQLPNLQLLSVTGGHEFMLLERHLHAIELMPNLQHLDLDVPSDGTWSESTLEPLRHMSGLTTLSLRIEMSDPLLISPSLAALTQLQDLHLHCGSLQYKTDQDHLMQTVSKLTELRSLVLDGMVESIPVELERLPCLTYLELCSLNLTDPYFAIPPSFGMCTKLRHICLSYLEDASDEVWHHICRSLLLLPQLHALDDDNVDLPHVQPSSWVLPSSLTSLNIIKCRMSMLPAAICCLPQLKRLSIQDSDQAVQLTGLPRGPYLHNLLALDIIGTKDGVGPEALTDAVHLQALRVQSRQNLGPLWTRSALRRLVPAGCRMNLGDGANDKA